MPGQVTASAEAKRTVTTGEPVMEHARTFRTGHRRLNVWGNDVPTLAWRSADEVRLGLTVL